MKHCIKGRCLCKQAMSARGLISLSLCCNSTKYHKLAAVINEQSSVGTTHVKKCVYITIEN